MVWRQQAVWRCARTAVQRSLQGPKRPQCSNFFPCWARSIPHSVRFASGASRGTTQGHSHREETDMDLRMRLNYLAAVLSFGFVTAIVFGIV